MDRITPGDPILKVEAELAAYYDDEADARVRRPLGNQRLEARRRFLAEIDMSVRLLELGTGVGRDVGAFVARAHSVVGVDLSFEQARHARAAGAQQVLASVRQLPFLDDSFAALWSMSTLMHVPNSAIQTTLGEVRRVLAPGAVAAIGVWGGPDVEDHGDRERDGGLRRLFSRRSDATWHELLETVGEVLVYETWSAGGDDFWYQWALLRVPGGPTSLRDSEIEQGCG